MAKGTVPVSREEFDEWKENFVTRAVMAALGQHAFDVKIGSLEDYWNNINLADQPQLYAEKRAAQAKIEVIVDLQGMNYDTLASYYA
jgi:hypothetical protein